MNIDRCEIFYKDEFVNFYHTNRFASIIGHKDIGILWNKIDQIYNIIFNNFLLHF